MFAPPAIAVSVGSDIDFLIPSINAIYATVGMFILFILVNLIGVKGAAIIELVATVLALIGLSIYYVAGLPHVQSSNIFNDMAFSHGWSGVLAAIPLFGVELPLAGVILTIFGVAIVYYFLVGSKKLRPMSEEFVSIEDVTSEETGTEEQIG